MEIFVKIVQFVLSLSILIVAHEFGHFFFAKLFKTRVEKFYLFFDPWFSLFKYKKGDTEYGVGWIPLGGYVKISGMIDESMDKEQMSQPPQPWEFRSKSVWQRFWIMFAGVFVNFLLALFLYVVILFNWGESYLPANELKYGIAADSLALYAGLQDGDQILSIDNVTVERFNAIATTLLLEEAKTIQILRNGNRQEIELPADFVARLIQAKGFISPRIPFQIEEVVKDSPAEKAGLKPGDRIIGVDGIPALFSHEVLRAFARLKGQAAQLSVVRGTDTLSLAATLTPEGQIGVIRDVKSFFTYKTVEYGILESIPAGIERGISTASNYLKQFKLFFQPKTKAYESLGGFITIGSIFPAEWNWEAFWSMTAFLSIILAIMNILPIPALDGGHLMFLFFEIITGRKPSDKVMEYAQITGMIILFALLIFANGNDVLKLFR
ncbi:MAG: RIP metalloprotease RseP [Bacteroidales bacterium]